MSDKKKNQTKLFHTFIRIYLNGISLRIVSKVIFLCNYCGKKVNLSKQELKFYRDSYHYVRIG